MEAMEEIISSSLRQLHQILVPSSFGKTRQNILVRLVGEWTSHVTSQWGEGWSVTNDHAGDPLLDGHIGSKLLIDEGSLKDLCFQWLNGNVLICSRIVQSQT